MGSPLCFLRPFCPCNYPRFLPNWPYLYYYFQLVHGQNITFKANRHRKLYHHMTTMCTCLDGVCEALHTLAPEEPELTTGNIFNDH